MIEVRPDTGTVLVAADFTAQLDESGNHLDSTAHPDDLMNHDLQPGVRTLPSELDVRMLTAAYDAAAMQDASAENSPAALLAPAEHLRDGRVDAREVGGRLFRARLGAHELEYDVPGEASVLGDLVCRGTDEIR